MTGARLAATLFGLEDVAVDSHGDLFLVDQSHDVVREVNAATGVITTVTGNGISGSSGDGGPATSAELSSPFGIAVDGQGHLFIGDQNNDVIREVNLTTGVITTYAGMAGQSGDTGDGGKATSAKLTDINGLAVDSQGDLFIADEGDYVIREVNASTGNISTVAGMANQFGSTGDNGQATSAKLNGPVSVAVDSQGDLFIADSGNHAIREVNGLTGVITTVAGKLGQSGATGDGGAATSALLEYPTGVTVDAQGNLYIVDEEESVVRRGEPRQRHHHHLRRQPTQSGFSGDNGPASAALLEDPQGVAVDSQGDLFIADQGNDVIRKVTPVASITNVLPASGTVQGGGTTKISWTSTGVPAVDILLSTDGGGTFGTTIASNEPNFGVYAWSVPADLGTSTAEIEVVAHGSTTVKSVSAATFTINQATTPIISTIAGVAPTGSDRGDGGPAVAAKLNGPTAVAVDSQGDLFIADSANNEVREIHAGTGVITTVAGNGTAGFSGDGGPATSARLNGPSGVAVDGQGNLFIADANSQRIREVNLATGTITTVAGTGMAGVSGDGGQATSAKLFDPTAVAVDSQGHLFIADAENDRIREVNLATGVISTFAGGGAAGLGDNGPATSAELNIPEGVAVDSHGDVFIADYDNNRIREVNAQGIITTVAGNGTSGSSGDGGPATSAELLRPHGVAVDAAGNLYIADLQNQRIREVNLGTGVITTLAGTGAAGSSGDNGPAASATLHNPYGVAVDGKGDVFIADGVSNVIREVTPAPSISNVAISTATVQGGGNALITWSSDAVTNVDILLSTNGGSTFPYTIAANLPSSGSYAWNVPTAESATAAAVRVVDASNDSIEGTSGGAFSITPSSVPIISTFAGSSTGSFGSSGDGGLAVSALLDEPLGVAVDGKGDVFFSDYKNEEIREVNGLTGVITTVAGDGSYGYTGDGGPATSATAGRASWRGGGQPGRPVHRRQRQRRDPRSKPVHGPDHDRRWKRHGGQPRRRRAGDQRQPGLSHRRGGGRARQPLHLRRQRRIREVNLSTGSSPRWPATARPASPATAERRPAPN